MHTTVAPMRSGGVNECDPPEEEKEIEEFEVLEAVEVYT